MWTNVIKQLKDTWNRLTISQKGMISVAAAACVVLVLATVYWATLPDYVALASGLSPGDAAEIMGHLESRNIDYKLSLSGSAITVPRNSLARARLAINDVLDPEVTDSSGGFGAFPGSPIEETDNRTREQERRISQTLLVLESIRSAKVHISKAPDSPFVSEQRPSTASVILDLNPTVPWSGRTAQHVLLLVANSVEGLRPENITLMDTDGRMFAASSGTSGHMSSQFEHQQTIEQSLSVKAETMLSDLLGPGKASVRVTADIDFKETTRTETTFDPDGKIKKTETIETVSQTGGVRPSSAVGIPANLNADLGSGDSAGNYKKETNSTDYDHPRIDETVKDTPGTILRLSIAAIVDLTLETETAEDGTDGTASQTSSLSETDVEAIIKQAVGYDETRGDAFTVAFAPMKKPVPVAEVPGFVATVGQYEGLIDRAMLGVGMLLAAVLGVLALRRMKPVVVGGTTTEGLSPEQLTQILELSERVKGSPDAAAQILSVWMGDEEETSGENKTRGAA